MTVAGEPRDFPTNLLLGAEEVLARMYFEHTKSKEYTAVGLGEILQRRTFTAAMEVNPLAVRRHKKKGQAIRIVDGALVHDREDPWNPGPGSAPPNWSRSRRSLQAPGHANAPP